MHCDAIASNPSLAQFRASESQNILSTFPLNCPQLYLV
ncbi:hypothetical protein COO91_03150 [Nostoc flagelliforme CCNUN1]|uniref:Uncharacterized protein n=1 Tax=Nostoc flagelliforme CCNUN1 TaxID=2038116 RepID=A0A2K8SP34_9NOSO|nr:hypothetical protein COO91_03150 [Nostoc flagelliforme CCNUN1]